jgi:bile acid:Na+ symporter, BASS family
MSETLKVLDEIRLNFSPAGLHVLNITIAFIMFGVALGLKTENFLRIVTNPKPVIIGVLAQFIFMPAMTFLLILVLDPSPSVALGMILVAACPGGNISNFFSAMARGNVELSVSLTGISDISAIIMTPFNFAFWATLYSSTSDLFIPITIDPFEMLKIIVILLGIPTVLGMFVAARFPKFTAKIFKPIKIFSIIFFFLYIVIALGNNFGYFLKFIHLIFLIVLIHNALALLTGFSLARIFRLKPNDTRTVTIETGIQNSGLGLVLIFNPHLFNGLGGMAFIAAWWGIWHIISGLTIGFFWGSKPYKSELKNQLAS